MVTKGNRSILGHDVVLFVGVWNVVHRRRQSRSSSSLVTGDVLAGVVVRWKLVTHLVRYDKLL